MALITQKKLEKIRASVALTCEREQDVLWNGVSLNSSRAMDPSLNRGNQFFILQGFGAIILGSIADS